MNYRGFDGYWRNNRTTSRLRNQDSISVKLPQRIRIYQLQNCKLFMLIRSAISSIILSISKLTRTDLEFLLRTFFGCHQRSQPFRMRSHGQQHLPASLLGIFWREKPRKSQFTADPIRSMTHWLSPYLSAILIPVRSSSCILPQNLPKELVWGPLMLFFML